MITAVAMAAARTSREPRAMVGVVDQQQLPALAAPGRLGDDPAIGNRAVPIAQSANGVDTNVAPFEEFLVEVTQRDTPDQLPTLDALSSGRAIC